MCNHCVVDPRDRLASAEDALLGLTTLVSLLPPNETLEARMVGGMLTLIYARMASAAHEIQNYVPRA